MYFNSVTYPFFLAAAVAVYWVLPKRYRLYWLIAASLFFYSVNDATFLVFVLGLVGVVVVVREHMVRHDEPLSRMRLWFGTGVGIVLSALLCFKYGNLVLSLTPARDTVWIAMPLGISFFTFEFIHYLVELYHRRVPAHTRTEFMTFSLFFPTLLSGPIKRIAPFLTSLRTSPADISRYMVTGCWLIIFGYAQKYLIADVLIERTVFLSDPMNAPSRLALLTGLFFYSFRIFFDFAGLSNIAIGSALLFGITVPINFHWPYGRKDLASFWKYWHMSLTNWIRDYIYMPLVFRFRHHGWVMIVALIGTMGLVGMWHGATLNFLFFGLYHGAGLALLQAVRQRQRRQLLPLRIRQVGGALATFVFVMFGWPFFVTHSLTDSLYMYKELLSLFL